MNYIKYIVLILCLTPIHGVNAKTYNFSESTLVHHIIGFTEHSLGADYSVRLTSNNLEADIDASFSLVQNCFDSDFIVTSSDFASTRVGISNSFISDVIINITDSFFADINILVTDRFGIADYSICVPKDWNVPNISIPKIVASIYYLEFLKK